MSRTGRPKAQLILTPVERAELSGWARRASTPQALALRAKIVLACADGADNKAVADLLRCSENTVGKWRGRFIDARLDGLRDRQRSGRPSSVGPDRISDVIVKTLTEAPADVDRWTRESMAARTGLSTSTIGKIWNDFGLRHGAEVARLPAFRDAVGLFVTPPDVAMAICDHSGFRRGEQVPPATEPTTRPQRSRVDSAGLLQFLERVDAEVPAALRVHVLVGVREESGLPSSVSRWLDVHPRVIMRQVAQSDWHELAEQFRTHIIDRLHRYSDHDGIAELDNEVRGLQRPSTGRTRPVVWVKSRGRIQASLRTVIQRTLALEDDDIETLDTPTATG